MLRSIDKITPLLPSLRRIFWSPPLDLHLILPRRTGTPPDLPDRLLPCGAPDWLKFNVDGALLPSRQAGAGIAARDSSGTVLFAADRLLLQWDPGRTELVALAALRDFLISACVDAPGMIIEGNCRNLIEYCQRSFALGRWDATFRDDAELGFLFELLRVLFQHVPHAANRVADYCVELVISSVFCWTAFEDFSSVLSEIVQSDRETILGF
ncbi:hypothetical protein KSP40_PGU006482 [Platanthera guangdongensis]|uniref:RNase H type-1 domain-containing protein n=1 Tax=Platanthera guangdongensis TaxID=2320717 RepID=A0ABR2LT96_9ASPA